MRYIFLDVDGVLNNDYTKPNEKNLYHNLEILDYDNVFFFKELMDKVYTKYGKDNVKIILSSTWRHNMSMKLDKVESNGAREALDKYLAGFDIKIDDETPPLIFRGKEIWTYLKEQEKTEKIEGIVIIDDIFFLDFWDYGLTPYFVQTSAFPRNGCGGFREKHISKVIEKLEVSFEWKEKKHFD